jgi:hypothetical protein
MKGAERERTGKNWMAGTGARLTVSVTVERVMRREVPRKPRPGTIRETSKYDWESEERTVAPRFSKIFRGLDGVVVGLPNLTLTFF